MCVYISMCVCVYICISMKSWEKKGDNSEENTYR